VTNKLPINVDKTNVMILTGKRLEYKLDFKPSVKFSDHELVSNTSSVACVASVTVRSVQNSGHEKEFFRIRAARKMGQEQKGGRTGVGEGKEGNACPQTP